MHTHMHSLSLSLSVWTVGELNCVQAWLAEINEYAQEDVVIMLLGNKCDSTTERAIRKEDGERLGRVW